MISWCVFFNFKQFCSCQVIWSFMVVLCVSITKCWSFIMVCVELCLWTGTELKWYLSKSKPTTSWVSILSSGLRSRLKILWPTDMCQLDHIHTKNSRNFSKLIPKLWILDLKSLFCYRRTMPVFGHNWISHPISSRELCLACTSRRPIREPIYRRRTRSSQGLFCEMMSLQAVSTWSRYSAMRPFLSIFHTSRLSFIRYSPLQISRILIDLAHAKPCLSWSNYFCNHPTFLRYLELKKTLEQWDDWLPYGVYSPEADVIHHWLKFNALGHFQKAGLDKWVDQHRNHKVWPPEICSRWSQGFDAIVFDDS